MDKLWVTRYVGFTPNQNTTIIWLQYKSGPVIDMLIPYPALLCSGIRSPVPLYEKQPHKRIEPPLFFTTTLILSLRNDLAAREKSAGIDDKAFEELLAELGDRNNRKQNIIMFGVPESDTHDANTRRSRELETVQAVLKALPSGMNTDHIEGTGELRGELERIQALNANLQKSNLRLEAENLEFRLDLEKSSKELPHLREQIQHLENYIEVLKNESSTKHEVTNSGDHAGNESKKTAELERTVFVLKRIVEKLQAENKRLQGGSKMITEKVSDETLRRDFYRLKEQYGDSIQKVARMEDELAVANNKIKSLQIKQNVASELDEVKNQLSQKTELLDKVKVLLHRAAVKEKTLTDEITKLKTMVPCSTPSVSSN
ncbi:hypothetical protein Trydic_g4890 [Trypoxylus dichotomus]